MNELTRRQVLRAAAAAGLLGGTTASALARKTLTVQERTQVDRDFVLEAGMTEAEADCWDAANQFAGAYLGLEPMGQGHEHIHAIHVLQEKMLSRPTYRRYLEAAGGGGRQVESDSSLSSLATPVDHEPAIESGLTDEEAECWSLLAHFASEYESLPKLHPMEDHELPTPCPSYKRSFSLARLDVATPRSSGSSCEASSVAPLASSRSANREVSLQIVDFSSPLTSSLSRQTADL